MLWDVWDVRPQTMGARPTDDTEQRPRVRSPFSRELSDGWLCFEAGGIKRRLWPIPTGWEMMNERDLATLCARASTAPPGRNMRSDDARRVR
jgi:hypothetical protein